MPVPCHPLPARPPARRPRRTPPPPRPHAAPAPTGGRAFTPTVALRPGEQVQIDTTRLDVLAVFDDGTTGRPRTDDRRGCCHPSHPRRRPAPGRHQGRGRGPAAGGDGRPPPGPPHLARRPAPGPHPTAPVPAAADPGRTARGRGSPAGGGTRDDRRGPGQGLPVRGVHRRLRNPRHQRPAHSAPCPRRQRHRGAHLRHHQRAAVPAPARLHRLGRHPPRAGRRNRGLLQRRPTAGPAR
ncbi:hypothetical protein SAFG77S_04605 [Streptomyces afghaniensis]